MPELQEDQIVEFAVIMAERFHRIFKGELYDSGSLPAPHRHRYAWLDSGILLSHLTFACESVDADRRWLDIMTRAVRLVVPDAPPDQMKNLLTHAQEYRDIWMEHHPNGAPLSVVLEVGINSAYNLDEGTDPATRQSLILAVGPKCLDDAGGLVTEFFRIIRNDGKHQKQVGHSVAGQPPAVEKPDYFYIRCVTLEQLFKQFKGVLAWWFGLSLVTVVFGLIFNTAKRAFFDATFLNSIPKDLWIWLAIAVFGWVLRGKTMRFPDLSFVAWILLNVWIGGVMIASVILPWWAVSPVYWALFLLGFVFEQLVEAGKANYDNAK